MKIIKYLICIIIISFIISAYSYAASTLNGSDIYYDNKTGMESINVQDAIDELYLAQQENNYVPSQSYSFEYKGSEEVFVAPYTGKYKLETWGAQGGSGTTSTSYTGVGGYGAYATGEISLKKGDKLYINVGGAGVTPSKVNVGNAGGYNGGGKAYPWNNTSNGSGGGATSIAKHSGLLSSLTTTEKKKGILLVAAGGGAGASDLRSGSANGGHGGSQTGGNGSKSSNNDGYYGLGGSQIAGGSYVAGSPSRTAPSAGSFGQGGDGSTIGGAGGGAGYFGGGGASVWAGAGGGSSYIENEILTNAKSYGYGESSTTTCSSPDALEVCSKQGNGHARITLYSSGSGSGTFDVDKIIALLNGETPSSGNLCSIKNAAYNDVGYGYVPASSEYIMEEEAIVKVSITGITMTASNGNFEVIKLNGTEIFRYSNNYNISGSATHYNKYLHVYPGDKFELIRYASGTPGVAVWVYGNLVVTKYEF